MKRTQKTPESQPLQQVAIADIEVPQSRHRSLRSFEELKASIAAVGLLSPIVVTQSNRLVAGHHRLKACEALGWKTIPAMVVPLSELDAELAEIDENLCRAELTVLERGEHLLRRKELYEARHPDAKVGAKGGGRGGKGARPGTENESISFSVDAAGRTGQSRRNVELEIQIAQNLPQEVRDALRGTPIADRKVDLLALARMEDAPERSAIVEALARGEVTTLAAAKKLAEATVTDETEALPPPVFDQRGHWLIDPGIAEAFTLLGAQAREALHHLRAAKRGWIRFHREQVAAGRVSILGSKHNGYGALRDHLEAKLGSIIFAVKTHAPYGLCPYCGGAPWSDDEKQRCTACGGVGWSGSLMYGSVPREFIDALDAEGVHEDGGTEDEGAEEGEDQGIPAPELTPGEQWQIELASEQARARLASKASPQVAPLEPVSPGGSSTTASDPPRGRTCP